MRFGSRQVFRPLRSFHSLHPSSLFHPLHSLQSLLPPPLFFPTRARRCSACVPPSPMLRARAIERECLAHCVPFADGVRHALVDNLRQTLRLSRCVSTKRTLNAFADAVLAKHGDRRRVPVAFGDLSRSSKSFVSGRERARTELTLAWRRRRKRKPAIACVPEFHTPAGLGGANLFKVVLGPSRTTQMGVARGIAPCHSHRDRSTARNVRPIASPAAAALPKSNLSADSGSRSHGCGEGDGAADRRSQGVPKRLFTAPPSDRCQSTTTTGRGSRMLDARLTARGSAGGRARRAAGRSRFEPCARQVALPSLPTHPSPPPLRRSCTRPTAPLRAPPACRRARPSLLASVRRPRAVLRRSPGA